MISQEITAKHSKMLEYLNFCLLCTLLALIFYLYIRMKRYLPLLKMAEDIFSSYDAQSDTKCQKFLECILTGNSKLYLGKVYTEEQLKKLCKEEVEKLVNNYEAKLSGQMVKSNLLSRFYISLPVRLYVFICYVCKTHQFQFSNT